jgi:diaminopimelate decarboxylase
MTNLHCLQKASPVAGVLQNVYSNGMGIEVATRPELVHALHLGFSSDKIVYDSPCKTWDDLEFALQHQVYINADNLQEIERLEKLLKDPKKQYSPAGIGLRINPQVGSGKIEATSTATMSSKFGTAYEQCKEKIVEAYKRNSWMNGIHCHIGSQGCSLELMVAGIKKVFGLVKEINAQKKQITWIDIGGGLPVNYEGDNDSPTFSEYVKELKSGVSLFFLK